MGRMSGAALAVLAATAAFTPAFAAAPGPAIITSDVARFYAVYDEAHGRPAAEALSAGYLQGGSAGLGDFVRLRIGSAEKLAAEVAKEPAVFAKARSCAAALPGARARLDRAFARLTRFYPPAKLPPITVLVGRNNSGGTVGPSGVLIGLEVVCRADNLQPRIEDRFVHLIAHEYAHVEQVDVDDESATPILLNAAMVEGGAEFVAEMISGERSERYIAAWVKGREREIGQAFVRDADKTDLKHWLWNGVGTRERPGDLGYWIGYRICRSYYRRAPDKAAAMRRLIEMKDWAAIYRESGWRPGD